MTQAAPTWVVGAGGLLGSHVVTALTARNTPVLRRRVRWSDPREASADLRSGIAELMALAGDGPWNVAWCAGSGIVSSTAEAMADESSVFRAFLADLTDTGAAARSAVFLASSGGGVYAGSPSARPLDEFSQTRALVPYGESRLAMEESLAGYVEGTGAHALVGRIANLYGPGQNLAKPQGLVSQVCLAYATGRPITIYVPLDTLRDYVFVEDAADLVAEALPALRHRGQESGERLVTKVVATGQTASIGFLLSEAARLFKRRVPVVISAPRAGTGQAPDLRMRSLVWRELDVWLRTSLVVGMARTADDMALRRRAA